MPSMTEDMTNLANSIVSHRHERAEATKIRCKATQLRGAAVIHQLQVFGRTRAEAAHVYHKAAEAAAALRVRTTASALDLHRRARATNAEAQRRELASFMTGLIDGVTHLREGFAVELTNRRVALKTLAEGVHRDLRASNLDRQGAADAWSGRKARPAARMPVPVPAPAPPPAPAAASVKPQTTQAAPPPAKPVVSSTQAMTARPATLATKPQGSTKS